ncbi:MAG TPA: hypothetical protein VFD05_03155 [Bacilli bacterium]|nr:hypothetical protein [Bacilli bacterium]
MNPLKRTTAVLDKTIRDLTKLSYWIFVVVQVIFLALYGFKIYTHLGDLIYFIPYVVLSVLSLFGFIFFLSTYKHRRKKGVMGTKRSVRIMKYLANGLMIVVLLIEFLNRTVTPLEIIVSVISILGFIAQVVIEVVRIFYERYAELFAIALEKDLAPFAILLDPKGKFYERINAPLAAMTGRVAEEKVPSRQELYVEQLKEDYEEKRRAAKDEHRQKKKESIKENIALIRKRFFGRREKDQEDEEQ